MILHLEHSAIHREAFRTDIPVVLRQRNVQEFEDTAKDYRIRLDWSNGEPGKARIDVSRSTPQLALDYLAAAGIQAVDIEAADVPIFAGDGIESRVIQQHLSRGRLADSLARKPEEVYQTIRHWIMSIATAPANLTAAQEEVVAAKLRIAGFDVGSNQIDPVDPRPSEETFMNGWRSEFESEYGQEQKPVRGSDDGIVDL